MGASGDWKHEKEAGRVADVLGVEAWRPPPWQRGREQALSADAGEVYAEGGLKTRDEGSEIRQCIPLQRTSVIGAQLPRGAGYDVRVIARTTSAAMKA